MMAWCHKGTTPMVELQISRTRSIPWLLMSWLLVLLCHYFTGRDYNHVCHCSVKKWNKMHFFLKKNIPAQGVNKTFLSLTISNHSVINTITWLVPSKAFHSSQVIEHKGDLMTSFNKASGIGLKTPIINAPKKVINKYRFNTFHCHVIHT